MKKTIIIIAIVLVAIGFILFALAFISAGCDFSKLGRGGTETNTYTTEEFIDFIEISSRDSDVVFKQSEDENIKVVCKERSKVKHNVSFKGGTLGITVEDGRKWYDHVFGLFSGSGSVTVYLPYGGYEYLKIEGATGDISIPNSFSFGNAEITLSTGNVRSGASVSWKFSIRTSTGDIKLDKACAKQMELSVSTGNVSITSGFFEDELTIDVGTGKTKLTDLTCKNVYIKGRTGDVIMKNVLAAGDFDIETGTGDVKFDNSDAENIKIKTSTGDVSGTLQSGKIFSTKTSTGSVNVPESTYAGKCDITTSTGDIDIKISGEKQEG